MTTAQDIIAFKAGYPEFGTDSDATIAAVFNTADVFLDASVWSQRDFAKARQLWVAHILTLKSMMGATLSLAGGSSSSTTTSGGLTDLFVRQIRIGERTVSFDRRQLLNTSKQSATGTGPGEDNLLLTLYGNLFLQLRQRNFPLVAIV